MTIPRSTWVLLLQCKCQAHIFFTSLANQLRVSSNLPHQWRVLALLVSSRRQILISIIVRKNCRLVDSSLAGRIAVREAVVCRISLSLSGVHRDLSPQLNLLLKGLTNALADWALQGGLEECYKGCSKRWLEIGASKETQAPIASSLEHRRCATHANKRSICML